MSNTIEHQGEENKSTSFGTIFRDMRKQKGLIAGRLAIKVGLYPTMLSNIEKEKVQPSISVACKLVSTLEIDLADFFQELATTQGYLNKENLLSHAEIPNFLLGLGDKALSEKNLFGFLFHEFRTLYKVTQKQVSEFSEYSIRNIQKVEAGTQTPNVMTALKMVCAVAQKANIDIDVFFHAYQKIIKEISE